MKEILDKHSLNLESKLKISANEIMTKMVNEPKYHEISNLHFAEIDRKAENNINEQPNNIRSSFIKKISKLKFVSAENKSLCKRTDHLENATIIDKVLLILMMVSVTGIGLWLYNDGKSLRTSKDDPLNLNR